MRNHFLYTVLLSCFSLAHSLTINCAPFLKIPSVCIFYLPVHTCQVASVVSDSLKPYGLHPARLFYPWDSPGKNTGVGSHSLLYGIFPTPGIKPGSPALKTDSLLSEPPGLAEIPKSRYVALY